MANEQFITSSNKKSVSSPENKKNMAKQKCQLGDKKEISYTPHELDFYAEYDVFRSVN
jgi:hypothetical protein